MPNIDLSGILSTFLGTVTEDSTATKGIISEPETTIQKATGIKVGDLNLGSLISIIVTVLTAYTTLTGQAKTEKAAEKALDDGKVDLSGMNVGNILGGLDLGSLLGLGGTAAAAAVEEEEEVVETKTTKKSSSKKSTKKAEVVEEVEEEEEEAAPASIMDVIGDSVKESITKSITESLVGSLTGSTTKKSSGSSDIVGSVVSGLVGSLLGSKK